MMFLRLRAHDDRQQTFPIMIYSTSRADAATQSDGAVAQTWIKYTNEFGIDGNVIIPGEPGEGWEQAYIMNSDGKTLEIIS